LNVEAQHTAIKSYINTFVKDTLICFLDIETNQIKTRWNKIIL